MLVCVAFVGRRGCGRGSDIECHAQKLQVRQSELAGTGGLEEACRYVDKGWRILEFISLSPICGLGSGDEG